MELKLSCHALDRFKGKVLANVELVQLKYDLELGVEASRSLRHMGQLVFLYEGTE